MRGRLIVVAGTDGSGKRTQTRLLVQRLRHEGREAETISFPQYERSFFGEAAGRYLRGEFGPAETVDPHLASIVFAMDRWEAKGTLEGWLASGRVVVADRYSSANAAHQAIKIADRQARARFVAWVDRMEHEVLGLPRPDLTVLLHMPWQTARRLVDCKEGRAYLQGARRDQHEADETHLERSSNAYLDLARTTPGWTAVECCREDRLLPPDAIAEQVWQAVQTAL